MGMRDNETILAAQQAVTTVGDTPSTNVYDSGSAAAADIGLTRELWLQTQCDVTATSAGAATVQPVLQSSPDGTTWTDAAAGPVTPLANLIGGTPLWQAPFPLGLQRYLRVVWRTATAALTAGQFSAFITLDVQRNIARPSGFSVQ